MGKVIRVVGASEHNLRNVSLDIPRDELVVLTGVSGSGKSSLAFDTVFREGQRRFVESLSSYARQFIGQMQKPAVERIEGLSPAICIDQKTVNRNPRSTVGTTTEILDHLRLLFARLGTASCPTCNEPIEARTPGQIAERLLLDAEGRFALVMAPVVRARKGEYRREQQEWREAGYQRARIDGELHDLAETKVLARYEIHTLELVIDRLKLEEKNLPRLREAIEKALGMAERTVSVLFGDDALEGRGTHRMFSATRACPRGHIELPEIEPRSFSFNNPHGACPRCKGLGQLRAFDDALLVPDGKLGLVDGALKAMTAKGNLMFAEWGARELRAISQRHGFSLATPWEDLPDEAREAVLREGVPEKGIEGAVPILERLYDQWHISLLERFMRSSACPACHGTRLGPVAQAVKFRDRTISDFTQQTIGELRRFFDGVELTPLETRVGREIFREIRERLLFLDAVGLGYLALDRSAVTLSGGEAQRIRLAAQVGAGLQGVLYVLDEPSIGLHPRDNKRLLATLRRLRDQGNSVLVVEHDEETMQSADSIVDIGPGAGSLGGEIVGQGRWDELAADPRSPTGEYLSGKRSVPMPAVRRPCAEAPRLVVRGARENNLKDVDIAIPLGRFVALTGVSGSGKSTLMDAILAPALENTLHGASRRVGHHHAIDGIEHLDKAVEIDQTPIGRTPRSNPATYTKVFDEIRTLFASLPESKARGYKPGQFSFNVAGGRCEECQGSGVREIEMQLLANVQVVCEECGGKRFGAPTLEVHFKGKTISDVLDMTIDQALEFFSALPKIRRGLETLQRIGLGYVHLGQPSTTLSGGEAQRMKLASELQRPATGKTIYLLDEPTTGLHFQDVERLVDALQELVDRGNTVLVIEHNLDLVRAADWVVDLGPEGGELGGYLLAQGTPEEVAADAGSATGKYLARAIEEGRTAAERAARHAARGADLAPMAGGRGKPSKAKARRGKDGAGLDAAAVAAETTQAIAAGERVAAERRGELEALEAAEGIALAEDQRDLDIRVRGACKHNLKNVSVRIPRHKLTVVTGPSGSGKTSLAFDTLFAEGQRRFVESLSTYARRFLGRLEKGDAESIEGLAPAIAIDQQTASRSPRSTVATATEIYDYLRLLWSRAGTAHDPGDGSEIRGWTAAQAADAAIQAAEGKILSILAPIFLPKVDFPLFLQSPEQLPRVADQLVELGFEIALVGEETVDLRACPAIRRNVAVSLRIDRVRAGTGVRRRVLEAALKARERGQGLMEFRWDGGGRMLLSTLPGNERTGYFQKEPWEPKHFSFNSHFGACPACEGLGWTRGTPCAVCKGDRLRPETAAMRVGGIRLPEFTRLTVDEALAFVRRLKLPRTAQAIAAPVLREILGRLQFLSDVGVGYLGLDRAGSTLSGGEAQRIRLASQIGSGLEGVLYVLDEPTVGLHQNDTARLIETLYRLRDLGNTVLVVEHDPELIRAADHVVDMGPGAGEEGGEVVASGSLAEVLAHPTSRTAQYLGGSRRIGRPQTLPTSEAWVRLRGAKMHNLKEIDCDIPMGRFTAIAGVSGSGKSTLALDLLVPALQARLEGKRVFRHHLRETSIEREVAEIVLVDQTPIGTTPRSNPASFTGVWDAIRDLFATLPESKVRGFDKGRFSFNMGGGRCPACEGRGYILLEMHFVSDVWVVCEACRGKRFQEDTLAVKFRGKDVSDVLAMRVDEAAKFFTAHRRVKTMLETLERIGLGYLRLGQPATELSGGEAQRLKIASELGRARRGRAVYILDEPTTGLHLSDIDRLVQALRLLVDRGDTVVVVEHQLDVIRAADWMLELGPGGGEAGGKVLFQGLPEDCPRSTPTGRALREYAAHYPAG